MADATESSRRRLDPETRRAEILAAALDVFAELGFGRATLQEVADRAGVTKGALYHYFDSKDALFLELMRERLGGGLAASRDRLEAAGPSLPRDEVLAQRLRDTWEWLQQPSMLDLAQLVMTELPNFPEVGRRFYEDIVAPARDDLRRIMTRGNGAGQLSERDVDTLVSILPSMLLGVAITQRRFRDIDPTPLDPDVVGDVVVRALMNGLAARAARGR